jgi:signal transduction histidine kinase
MGIASAQFGQSSARYLYVATAVTLIASVAFAIRSYRAVDSGLTEATLARRTALSSLAATTLNEKFARLIDIGISLATRVKFRQLIAAGRWEDAMGILRSVPEDFSFVERVFLTDPQGTERADIPQLPGVRGRSFAFRSWYKRVSAHWKPAISPIYRRTAAPQHVVFAVPVPIIDDAGSVIGILVLQVRLASFFDWARTLDLGAQGILYVVDSQGQAAFHPALDPQAAITNFSRAPLVEQLLHGEGGIRTARDPVSGVEQIAAFAPVSHGWGVVTEQPIGVAFVARDSELRRIAIGYLLLLVFGGVVAYLAVRLLAERAKAEVNRRHGMLLENTVRERTAELEATNQELESFSYSISHDLRAPLRAIDGFAQMLEEDFGEGLDNEGRRLLGVVRRSANNMGRLIDDLLTFSRLGRKPLEASLVRSTQLVAEVMSDLRDPEAHVEVVVSELPDAWADRSLLKQVWTNLIANALKYSAHVAAPRIDIGGREEGAETVFWVRDNGAGFDMRYVGKLFGVFQRLHGESEFPGTGVGLAIVRRVVTRHGGRVWAEGKVNEGANFYFSLPKQEPT